MGAIEELGSFLDTNSTRFTAGTNLWYHAMADEPGTATALYETGGLPPVQRYGNDLPAFERAAFQVVCRSTSPTIARGNAHAAWVIVQKVANESLSSKTWLRAEPMQSPFLLERDAQGRYTFAFNLIGFRATTST